MHGNFFVNAVEEKSILDDRDLSEPHEYNDEQSDGMQKNKLADSAFRDALAKIDKNTLEQKNEEKFDLELFIEIDARIIPLEFYKSKTWESVRNSVMQYLEKNIKEKIGLKNQDFKVKFWTNEQELKNKNNTDPLLHLKLTTLIEIFSDHAINHLDYEKKINKLNISGSIIIQQKSSGYLLFGRDYKMVTRELSGKDTFPSVLASAIANIYFQFSDSIDLLSYRDNLKTPSVELKIKGFKSLSEAIKIKAQLEDFLGKQKKSFQLLKMNSDQVIITLKEDLLPLDIIAKEFIKTCEKKIECSVQSMTFDQQTNEILIINQLPGPI